MYTRIPPTMPSKHGNMVNGAVMKQTLLIAASLFTGFLGGTIGAGFILARYEGCTRQAVRARGFELVNESGQAISYWGVDKRQNVVLAFGRQMPDPKPGGPAGITSLGLDNPENQRAAFGMVGDTPTALYRASDGRLRMSVCLSMYDKPIIVMEDRSGKRVSLGIQHSDTPGPQDDDWALAFFPDVATIGTFTREIGGQTYVRGLLSVSRDGVKYPGDRAK